MQRLGTPRRAARSASAAVLLLLAAVPLDISVSASIMGQSVQASSAKTVQLTGQTCGGTINTGTAYSLTLGGTETKYVVDLSGTATGTFATKQTLDSGAVCDTRTMSSSDTVTFTAAGTASFRMTTASGYGAAVYTTENTCDYTVQVQTPIQEVIALDSCTNGIRTGAMDSSVKTVEITGVPCGGVLRTGTAYSLTLGGAGNNFVVQLSSGASGAFDTKLTLETGDASGTVCDKLTSSSSDTVTFTTAGSAYFTMTMATGDGNAFTSMRGCSYTVQGAGGATCWRHSDCQYSGNLAHKKPPPP
ncbi:hypothetical protein T484DRAFT_1800527 [Baffinella frigidus]|nr:hypothetical protein T484DRAFT_1800527 [Cryptophyta sp. CCMP2293]